ncbi:hypothetical protein INR49_018446, partial [Caranx melampygus]
MPTAPKSGEEEQQAPSTSKQRGSSSYNLWLGLALALLSAFLIGGSVILKKKALLRLANTGHTRAGDGGHGYLKDWLWWGGLLTMGAGEVCNFVAYMFAPATLVTPLGALSVLISSVLLPVGGGVERGFIVYVSVVLLLCLVLVVYFSPRFGSSNILIYISICSLLGAFTVSSVKGLAIVINTVLARPLTWILLLTLIVSIVTQVNYLNKSLDTFNTLLVYPIYYVLFTSVVLSTSIILFQEWRGMAVVDVVTTVGAFTVIVVGVAMLHLFKELQVVLPRVHHCLFFPHGFSSVTLLCCSRRATESEQMDQVHFSSLDWTAQASGLDGSGLRTGRLRPPDWSHSGCVFMNAAHRPALSDPQKLMAHRLLIGAFLELIVSFASAPSVSVLPHSRECNEVLRDMILEPSSWRPNFSVDLQQVDGKPPGSSELGRDSGSTMLQHVPSMEAD